MLVEFDFNDGAIDWYIVKNNWSPFDVKPIIQELHEFCSVVCNTYNSL